MLLWFFEYILSLLCLYEYFSAYLLYFFVNYEYGLISFVGIFNGIHHKNGKYLDM
jgi:hypothetical protein